MKRKLHAKWQTELHTALRTKLHTQQSVSANHLEETIQAAQAAYAAAGVNRRMGFFPFLLHQFRFTGALVWALQGAVLLCACVFMGIWRQPGMPGYGIPTLLCFCAVLAGLTILPVWARARKYRMLELEASTFFSMQGILPAQMIIAASSNLIVLAIVGTIASNAAGLGTAFIIWNLLLPYLMACFGCVFLLGRVRAGLAAWLCVAVGGCLVVGFYLLFRSLAAVGMPTGLPVLPPVWKPLCIAFSALLMLELHSAARRAKTMETAMEF